MKRLAILALLSVLPAFGNQRFWAWCEQGAGTINVAGITSSTATPVQSSYPSCTWTVYVSGSESVQAGLFVSPGSATITGSATQTVTLTFVGGSGAIATATLTGTNTIAAGAALVINAGGTGFHAPATTAVCSNGTATCSGTVTVSTTMTGTLASIYSDNLGTPILSSTFTVAANAYGYFYAANGRYDVVNSGGTPQAIPAPFTLGDVLLFDPGVFSQYGVILSAGAAGFVASTPGIFGQPFISGGPTAYGAYGPLNIGGGPNIITGVLPIVNGGTGTPAPAPIAGSGISITGIWPNQTFSAIFLPPAAGALQVYTTTELTALGPNVVDFGAYCDGVENASTGAWTGHDDSAALQAAFNALGTVGVQWLYLPAAGLPSGPVGGGTSTGFCLSSIALGIGNGSSSAVSTVNGFHVIGQGGYQTVISSATGRYILANPGTSVIAYSGSADLGTTPFLTVNGPVHDIELKGFAADCHYHGQTCIEITHLSGSHVTDVFALNNEAYTNIWNAGFVVAAYQSQFNGAESGSQNNVFNHWGTISGAFNVASSLIRIGCQDEVSCVGSGLNAYNDVSGNTFLQTVATDYGGIATGLVRGYEDSNRFDQIFIAAYEPVYTLVASSPFAGFPGAESFAEANVLSSPGYESSWVLADAITSGSQTSIVTTLSGETPVGSLPGQFIQIDSEIMRVTANSSGTLTVARGVGATYATTHSAAAPIQGPFGYSLDSASCPSLPLGNSLYIDPMITFDGYPVGTTVESQISPTVCGVVGVTQAGYKFNTPQSGPLNPFLVSSYAYGPTIANTASFIYFSSFASAWAPVISPQMVYNGSINQGTVIHFKMLMGVTNTGGSADTVFGSMRLGYYSGTYEVFSDANGLQIPASGVNNGLIQAEGTIKITYTANAYAANIIVDAKWQYSTTDTSTNVTTATAWYPMITTGANNSYGPVYLTDGLPIDFGARCSSAASTCTVNWENLDVWLEGPASLL